MKYKREIENLPIFNELFLLWEYNLMNFFPWQYIVNDDRFMSNLNGFKERYPNQILIPLAVRIDIEDKACFDLKENNIIVMYDYAPGAYENRIIFKDFWEWYTYMNKGFIEYHTFKI